jgi:phosphotransferase system HPr (HPr) family protein
MIEKKVILNNAQGLHARPASLVVEHANRHSCEIFISRENRTVNAKSILGVLTLACGPGEALLVSASGGTEKTEKEAVLDIVNLINSGFGE